MTTEFEAKFLDIDKSRMRSLLRSKGAKLIRKEFLQKRLNFHLPDKKRGYYRNAWIRVRDEGDKITLAVKMVLGHRIHDQKEIQVTVDDFKKTTALLEAIGCEKRIFQESKRELWHLGGTEITIDTWPCIKPFIEIEGMSERVVRKVAKILELDYTKAVFGSVGMVYHAKFGIWPEEIEKKAGEITFGNKKLRKLLSSGE
jgi:adenylate cyclase, class 2